MSESIIQIQHLNKTFGTGETAVHALEDINLDIRRGEIFGIIGLSGAGKSTLVRCMNLLERPTSGSITVNGQRLAWMEGEKLTTISERELRLARRNVTMIFQSFNLLMQRTCLQNVCFPMELSGLPRQQQRKRAMELLDLVGLRDKADAYPAQLSGGQKQRVAIARSPGNRSQGSAVRRSHFRTGPQHHRLHPDAFEGPQPKAGCHRGGHHPPDERDRGDLLPGRYPGRRRHR